MGVILDREAAEEAANLPGIAMIVIGALNAIAWGLGAVGSVIGFVLGGITSLFTGLASLAGLASVFSTGEFSTIIVSLAGLFSTVMGPVLTVCNGCVNVVFLLGSVVAILGGLKLRGLEAPGTVKMGAYALAAGPFVSILVAFVGVLASVAPTMVSALVLMDIGTAIGALFGGCCGVIAPIVTNGVMIVFNGGIAFWALSTLNNEDVAAAMEAAGE